MKLLFSKERRLFVRDAALITVTVDKHDHRGQTGTSNRPVGTLQSVLSRKRKWRLLRKQESSVEIAKGTLDSLEERCLQSEKHVEREASQTTETTRLQKLPFHAPRTKLNLLMTPVTTTSMHNQEFYGNKLGPNG